MNSVKVPIRLRQLASVLVSNSVRQSHYCNSFIYQLHRNSFTHRQKPIEAVTSSIKLKEPVYLNQSTHRNCSTYKMESKEELRKRLTPIQFQVTQEASTERPFTGKYNKCYDKGVYRCVVCHEDLFKSDTKYDSGCGWPAFNDVLEQGKVTLHKDSSISDRVRTEVRCAKCGAHMGHVFDDGPKPTRKRYCINSAAIDFVSAEELNKGV